MNIFEKKTFLIKIYPNFNSNVYYVLKNLLTNKSWNIHKTEFLRCQCVEMHNKQTLLFKASKHYSGNIM